MLPRRAVNAFIAACAVGDGAAALAAGGGDAPHDTRDVRDWQMRIHEAASRRNFEGTFVVSAAGTVASSRIAHFGDGPRQLERIDSLDGRMRRVLRRDDLVYTLWPESRTAVVEQRDLLTTFPALLQAGHDHLAHYAVIDDWHRHRAPINFLRGYCVHQQQCHIRLFIDQDTLCVARFSV